MAVGLLVALVLLFKGKGQNIIVVATDSKPSLHLCPGGHKMNCDTWKNEVIKCHGYREGKQWKTMRTAVGKQATPKCVHSYAGAFNVIYNNFMDYIRSSRGEDRTVDDLIMPFKYLLVESEPNQLGLL